VEDQKRPLEERTVGAYPYQTSEPGGGSAAELVRSFESLVENPLSRFVLKRATAHCRKDGGRRAEVGLELNLGLRGDACLSCRWTSWLIGLVLKRGVSTFGMPEQDFREGIANPHWRKGLINVITGLADFGVRRPFVPSAPFQIVWNITRACNLRCKHCYESAGSKAKDELPDDKVLEGIETISRASVSSIAFSGGEPTLHPSILDFIGAARDRGIYVAVATNGYSFSDANRAREFKRAGLSFAQVSLDGLSPEVHDAFRGVPGSWEHAVAAIKNCVAEDLTVCVSTTVTRYNQGEIPAMLDLARSLGVKWYMLYNFIPTGRGMDMVSQDLTPDDRRELLETAFQANCEGMQVLSTAPQYAPVIKALTRSAGSVVVPTHFYNLDYTNTRLEQISDFIGGCGAGRFYLAVEPNGDIYPCVFFPHTPELKVGNLMDGDLELLWRSSPLLQALRDKDRLKGHCPDCENRYICGGCRARAYAYYHDVLGPDPGCINNAGFWEELSEEAVKAAPGGVDQRPD